MNQEDERRENMECLKLLAALCGTVLGILLFATLIWLARMVAWCDGTPLPQ